MDQHQGPPAALLPVPDTVPVDIDVAPFGQNPVRPGGVHPWRLVNHLRALAFG